MVRHKVWCTLTSNSKGLSDGHATQRDGEDLSSLILVPTSTDDPGSQLVSIVVAPLAEHLSHCLHPRLFSQLQTTINSNLLLLCVMPTKAYMTTQVTCFLHIHAAYYQGLIEPPKAARGYATHTDGEIQHVTKFKFT